MTRTPTRHTAFWALFIFVLLVPAASFASTPEPAWKFNRAFNVWTQALNTIEQGLGDPDGTTERAEEIRAELNEIREKAVTAGETAQGFAEETENLLAALGAAPAADGPPEAEDVAAKRRQYEAKIADFRGRTAQAQLIVRRTDSLLVDLAAIEQGQALRILLTRNPSPFAWTTLAASPAAGWQYLASLAETPRNWWQSSPPGDRDGFQVPAALIFLLFLVAAAIASHRLLVRLFGRDETIADPSYTRRLLASSTEALANGLLPAILAAALWVVANQVLGLEPGPFLDLVNGLVAAALIIIAAISLPRAALSPAFPNWRVVPIKPKYARHLSERIGALGILFAIDTFIGFTASQADIAFLTVYNGIIATLEAALILDLLRPALWRTDRNWHPGGQKNELPAAAESEEASRSHTAWHSIRLVSSLIVVAGAVAAWIGYTALSVYLINNLMGSALVVGALFLLHALFAEWIGILMSRQEVVDWLNLSTNGRETVKFWLVGLMRVTVYLVGAALVGAVWGIPLNQIWSFVYNLLTAIQVGDITISIADIVEAFLVLLVTLIIFRLGKRLLRETVLPQTRLDPGAQYSIVTVFGYIGIVTAFVLGAVTLGVDFQNLIIIAGALSVGIGFGLQNIANNFISGLILLFERPVKVGDLIEIGDTLGHITHINVRRTEVETFSRSEVMIPNSELVSATVINWTHTNRQARIEINVGVAYGTDTNLVRTTLLKAAENVDKILKWPLSDVLFLDFGDSSLNFQLRCFTSDVSSRIVTASNLRFEVDRLFREAGIQIPFPQRVLHMAHDEPRLPEPPATDDPAEDKKR